MKINKKAKNENKHFTNEVNADTQTGYTDHI